MFWTIYEILINLCQSLVFTWFITKMLPKKKEEYLSSLCCAILTTIALSTYLFFPMPNWDSWIFIFIIFYALYFFNGSILQKVFWVVILIIISTGIIGISYQFVSLFTRTDTESLLATGYIRILFTVLANFLFVDLLFYTVIGFLLPMINEIGLRVLDQDFIYNGDYNAFVMLPMISVNVLITYLTYLLSCKVCKKIWNMMKAKFAVTLDDIKNKSKSQNTETVKSKYKSNTNMQISDVVTK